MQPLIHQRRNQKSRLADWLKDAYSRLFSFSRDNLLSVILNANLAFFFDHYNVFKFAKVLRQAQHKLKTQQRFSFTKIVKFLF